MKWIPASVLACVLAIVPLTALAATPGLPHQFYGTVSYDSGTTPAGLTVRALVGSTIIATATSVTQSNGKYGVMPDLLIVSDQTAGATLHFSVNDTLARETATFVNGTLTNLNLTVPGVAPSTTTTNTTAPTQTSNNGVGGGSTNTTTNTVPAVTPLATTLTAAQKPYDANNDNRIDVLDFNALMVHWGERGTTVVADFDKNGIVDVFDFNALMVHWTV